MQILSTVISYSKKKLPDLLAFTSPIELDLLFTQLPLEWNSNPPFIGSYILSYYLFLGIGASESLMQIYSSLN